MRLSNVLIALAGVLLLGACGGGSDDEPDIGGGNGGNVSAPLSVNYYGIWQLDSDTFVGISEQSLSTYIRNPNLDCFDVDLFKRVSSTANSMVSEDVVSGERSTSNFSLNGSNLRVTEGNVTLEFFSGNLPIIANGCDTASTVSFMNVSVELEYLPDAVLIDRNAQATGRVEYQYGVHFDINQNSVVDAGDVAIQLQHYKSATDEQTLTALSGLDSNIWNFIPRQQAQGYSSTSSSLSKAMVQLSQDGSTLLFSIDMTRHPLLRFVDADTPLFIYSYINHPQPDTTVIDGWADGPWNWSSETHEDRFPDSGFTQMSLHPNMQMLDAANDLSRGQAKWVDIKAISFSFID
tara:strand:- start:2951 stop:3997 length:1047 start_codon:yes stop_codon:yes gene_type:complete